MTSGTKTTGNPQAIGSYFTKTWSGADNPKRTTAPVVRAPPTAYYAWVKGRKGTMERKLFWHKGELVRPTRRARLFPPHPYQASGSSGTNVVYQGTSKFCPPPTFTCNFNSGPGTYGAGLITPNMEISLIGRLGDQIRGGDFDASVFLGTGLQSLDTITQSAVRIASALRSVRRGDLSTAAKTLTGKQKAYSSRTIRTDKAASSAWLELQYGWLPLVSDVYDSGSWLASLLNDPLRFRIKESIVIRDGKRYERGSNGSGVQWKRSSTLEVLSYIAYYKEQPSKVAKFGLTNPANLAWELLPWSFVCDWFAPVGGYLDARGVASMLPDATYIRTYFVQGSGQGLMLSGVDPNLTSISNAEGARSESWNISRTISTSISVPKPEFKPLEQVTNWRRAANAVALLIGLKSFGSK